MMLDEAIAKCYEVSDNVMIEEYIYGRETVGILGNKILPIVEIVPKNGFYDYDSNDIKGKSDYIVPANQAYKDLEINICTTLCAFIS